jgi:ATP-binding cassette subfamily B protein
MWIVYRYAFEGWSSLLLVFWAVSIPAIGAELASVAWSLPAMKNAVLRFLEPLGSPEQNREPIAREPGRGGVAVDFQQVRVVAGGHVVLDQINLRIAAAEHVAIVGPSGSGKSSLVGLLLGWHQPAGGQIAIDGRSFDDHELARLRDVTAWIDPEVHLFRATLFDNVRFGLPDGAEAAANAVERARLVTTLRRLPEGLQTPVGDRGDALSSGEGQRIRAARGFARHAARLAILDEPARGLDRSQRRALLSDSRRQFVDATLLVITHDIADTLSFDRVIVMENGRIVEAGMPHQLASQPESRYAALLREEETVRQQWWGHRRWRRFHMVNGTVEERSERRQWMAVSQ